MLAIFETISPRPGVSSALAWSATYAAMLILIAVILTFRVIFRRYRARVSHGTGGDHDLARAIRVHGNFVEHAPFALVALVLLPLLGGNTLQVHLVGGCMLLGRIFHSLGLSSPERLGFGRQIGMVLSQASLVVGAWILLTLAWRF